MKHTPKNISVEKLFPFEGHPFKVQDNEEMNALIESIQEHGVLSPLIVRPKENTTDEYEIISGHRRVMASRKAGMKEVPAFIVPLARDEAAIAVVDSNLHREHILPSEKAFAYKLKLEAMKHQGISCGQIGHKSRDEISDTDSGRTVQRYIRLTYLIPEFLEQMDEGRIAFSVGVELSHLNEQAQYDVLEQCEINDCTPSYSQASRLHKADRDGLLTKAVIQSVMSEEKANQIERVKIPAERIRKYFPSDFTTAQMEETIVKLCEAYHRKRTRDRDSR